MIVNYVNNLLETLCGNKKKNVFLWEEGGGVNISTQGENSDFTENV